jgi:ubiquinone/menaquinone biosynthesis C-methylase UbiE
MVKSSGSLGVSIMNYRCVQCGADLFPPSEGEGNLACSCCGFTYAYSKNYLKYDFASLLFKHFKKQYLFNQVLNNNAILSYNFLKEGSLSLSTRGDVLSFQRYILSQISFGKILDVGCGILKVPGYLDFERKEGFEFYGIDPIDDKSFKGIRITGCAEFMPFPNGSFDAIVYATSLDHVCSLKKTVDETYRVLSRGGKIIIWMSDRSVSLFEKIKNMEELWMNRLILKFGFKKEKLRAVDPFHSYLENPKRIIRRMRKAKLILNNMQSHHKNAVFLSFQKT